MNNFIPRPEYPNPQFERNEWICLNGEWDFAFDLSNSGLDRGFQHGKSFTHKINVPFVPESTLSGIEYKDFMMCIWYGKKITIPKNWANGRVFLNFGAIDYFAELYINGNKISYHRGSSAPFKTDITRYVKSGDENGTEVVLRAYDNTRSGTQTLGKQSNIYDSYGCFYTRTTGIWQTVWLEYIPSQNYIKSFKLVPDPDNKKVSITVSLSSHDNNGKLTALASLNGVKVSSLSVKATSMFAELTLNFDDVQLWEVGNGVLYDLTLVYETESGTDTVKSYFGMRSISITDNALLINGKPVFQRLVLDQGFYPDGVWTAPSDEALENDIKLSIKAGFNGARLHQKVFEPRFLYHADKLGYIVWGENASWGLNQTSGEAFEAFMGEWHEILTRDFNHPSIVGWCPFNETLKSQRNVAMLNIYQLTKNFDASRPVIDTSGYVHVCTDVFDIHDYDQDPESFYNHYSSMNETAGEFIPYNYHDINMAIPERMPYFVSEYGGTWWNEEDSKKGNVGWGYGQRPQNIEEVYERIEKLTQVLLNNKGICAFCYTQLTDIYPEQNGIYYFDRSPKFDMKRIHAMFSAPAAIEKQ